VSEGTGGVRRREADTEQKTKTPHVNVGNKQFFPKKLVIGSRVVLVLKMLIVRRGNTWFINIG